MRRFEGKVAVISGAARGQGRAHAVRLAREGADIVAFDICEPLRSPEHPAATVADLEETRRLVEAEDRRCLTATLDARDLPGLRALADQTVAELGSVDVLVVNHGLWAVAPNSWELSEDDWQESLDVMLTGTWKVTTAFIPQMIAAGPGGAIVVTSSVMGHAPQPGSIAYNAAKHGILAVMKTLSWELGSYGIRVNAVSPAYVGTPMTLEGPTVAKSTANYPKFFGTDRALLHMPNGWFEPDEIAKAVAYLASDEARYVTGVDLFVDAGWSNF